MSGLAEIEKAVAALPEQQKHHLFIWLRDMVGSTGERSPARSSTKQNWLQRCARQREAHRTTCSGTPLQQIMDDLRGR